MRFQARSTLAAVCAVALLGTGCGTTSINAGSAGGPDPEEICEGPTEDYTIGVSQANVAEPYRVRMNTDIRRAAAEVEQFDEVQFLDAAQDNSRQVSQIRTLITKQVDLLIVSPNEAAPLTGVVSRAYNSGIPVVVLDREINGDSYSTFIGADNEKIGRKAGEHFADRLLPDGGKVVELRGLSGSTPAAERGKGFRAGIRGSGIEIIASADGQWLRAEAQSKMDAILKAHPRVDAVYGHNDPMAEGAHLAARSAGRASGTEFVGIDGLPIPSGGIKAVQRGRLSATFVYPTGGEEAITAAKKMLIDCEPVPAKQTLPTRLVTPENAAKVYRRLNSR
ncbi:ribose transport system substrate-binding protein [Actinopolyspora xinjiangensis]|uniref:Ribose transport system substrate-binding protein n=1 Tax=Actinopolyspora xinjiangensis TaxID=405564 RepID=A0A1H0QQH2_9ACTN|nr:substrate-binding domain-containing protein [Actinopolyspora xinjiangensis]SDP19611.1 ribose transport system substrate-binding protein [Actinopolyspora xinjiangensis]